MISTSTGCLGLADGTMSPPSRQFQCVQTTKNTLEAGTELASLLLEALQLSSGVGQFLVTIAQLLAKLLLLTANLLVTFNELADLCL